MAASNPLHLKVISFNAWYRSDNYERALRYLEASGADVIGLIEITPDWKTALQSLEHRYPYRVDCIGEVPNCEMMLYSKYPFKRSYAGRIDGDMPTIALGEID